MRLLWSSVALFGHPLYKLQPIKLCVPQSIWPLFLTTTDTSPVRYGLNWTISVFFCCVNNIHPLHCQETTKIIVYLHTGGLEHVAHFTVLLVLKKSEIEDVCQELALILKIVSSQHGPCAGIKDLKFVSTDSKHELIFPTCSATATCTHIKTNGGVFTSSCVWWPAADCWRGTGRVVGRAYGTSWSLCCAVLPSAALHLSLATTVSEKW